MRKPRQDHQAEHRAAELPAATPTVTRIKIDRQGYDDNGAYYGAGQPVFLVTWPDGGSQALRAPSLAAARDKAAAMLAAGEATKAEVARTRAALAARAEETDRRRRERTRRYATSWVNPNDGSSIRIEIRHTKNYLADGTDHIEIESIAPPRTPLPITDSGYLSHFIDWRALKEAGGPVAFVTGWLAREQQSKSWRRRDLARRQGDLFQWADAQAETTAKPAKSMRPLPPRAVRARKDRAP